jgi:putative transposase
MVQAVTDQRPTYGHHRVTALLNRTLRQVGNAPVNRKRIYRIMKTHHLLLQRHTGRPHRTHDGRVITPQSNTRWCSDVFSIQCWNGDRVHVAVSLDTCDREAIHYVPPLAAWMERSYAT